MRPDRSSLHPLPTVTSVGGFQISVTAYGAPAVELLAAHALDAVTAAAPAG